MSGGLVLDYNKNEFGESRIKESIRLYMGFRINFKVNWAMEFLNLGMAVSKDFIVLRMNYIRAEYQF